MKRIFLFFVASLLIVVSCHRKSNDDIVSISSLSTNYDSLIELVVIKGDTNAYEELYYYYVESDNKERIDSILFYSRIMASNYNYERAYFDYLRVLCESNGLRNNFQSVTEINLSESDDVVKIQIKQWLTEMLEKKMISQEEFDSVFK